MSKLSVRYESEDGKETTETEVLDVETAYNFKKIDGQKRYLIINNHDTHGTKDYKPCQKILLDTLDI